MKPRQLLELIVLAILWGGSFLFMRVAAPQFGPAALIELRALVASIVLCALLLARREFRLLAREPFALTVLGIVNSAVPFFLLAYSTLSLGAGFVSILNATSPLWAAIVAYLWLGTRLSAWRVCGLILGFLGVVVLVWGRVSFGADGSGLAVLAGLGAGFSYGIAANYTRQKLGAMQPLPIAAGSQIAAALCLLPFALGSWPHQMPSPSAWVSVVVLGVASTAIAYLLYFRLIASVGPAKAITVTFLVPVFAVLWGFLLLSEPLTLQMSIGCAVILLGTAISTGLLDPRWVRRLFEQPAA